MPTIDEKRVFDDRTDAVTCLLAAAAGVVRVSVSGATVGEFGLVERCRARDVAVADGRRLVATEADVRVDGDPTGFGPARAVGTAADGRPVAAGDERVARLDGDGESRRWTTLGRVSDPRAVAGGLVAADGVYRVDGDGLSAVGLADVDPRDLSTGGARPLVATGEGTYALGPGWTRVHDRPAVAVDAHRDREIAAGPAGVVARDADEAWRALDAPDGVDAERVVAVGVAPEAWYAVTGDGRFAARTAGAWRVRSLGVGGVSALAVAG